MDQRFSNCLRDSPAIRMVEFRGEEEEEGKEKATYRVFGSFSWIERFLLFAFLFIEISRVDSSMDLSIGLERIWVDSSGGRENGSERER